jgi:hypothetical protein
MKLFIWAFRLFARCVITYFVCVCRAYNIIYMSTLYICMYFCDTTVVHFNVFDWSDNRQNDRSTTTRIGQAGLSLLSWSLNTLIVHLFSVYNWDFNYIFCCRVSPNFWVNLSYRASRRVLASGSIVSGFSFCNSLLVVKSNKFPKIAVKFARFDSLPNPSLTYKNYYTFISKFFHGSMASKINPPVGKFSNGYS